MTISRLILLRMSNVLDEVVEIRKTSFLSINFLSKVMPFMR
jgi:hypothetical protein